MKEACSPGRKDEKNPETIAGSRMEDTMSASPRASLRLNLICVVSAVMLGAIVPDPAMAGGLLA